MFVCFLWLFFLFVLDYFFFFPTSGITFLIYVYVSLHQAHSAKGPWLHFSFFPLYLFLSFFFPENWLDRTCLWATKNYLTTSSRILVFDSHRRWRITTIKKKNSPFLFLFCFVGWRSDLFIVVSFFPFFFRWVFLSPSRHFFFCLQICLFDCPFFLFSSSLFHLIIVFFFECVALCSSQHS